MPRSRLQMLCIASSLLRHRPCREHGTCVTEDGAEHDGTHVHGVYAVSMPQERGGWRCPRTLLSLKISVASTSNLASHAPLPPAPEDKAAQPRDVTAHPG